LIGFDVVKIFLLALFYNAVREPDYYDLVISAMLNCANIRVECSPT